MCNISNNYITGFNKKYQTCTCGQHIWSNASNKFIKPFRGSFTLYDEMGNRIQYRIQCNPTGRNKSLFLIVLYHLFYYLIYTTFYLFIIAIILLAILHYNKYKLYILI